MCRLLTSSSYQISVDLYVVVLMGCMYHDYNEIIPSSTPVTIDAKLSSRRIMSAACLDTSEPAIPMATPSNEQWMRDKLLILHFITHQY